MQTAFYFDATRCSGCCTCIVTCKDWHDIPAGPASWRRVIAVEKGNCPDVFVAFLSVSCHHCENPACISVCPVDAITKRDSDGIVLIDRESCLGRDDCGACLEACPYKSPQFGDEPDAKMQKCDFCLDRLAERKKPYCVEACFMRALDAGPIEEIRAKYGDDIETEGFVYDQSLKPAIILKPKRDTANRIVQRLDTLPLVTERK
ncbi:4Fe-4S dicluster domain-containing protein [Thermodesulfobacteriota bacterium]